jgi:hypothetical protein
MAVPSEAVACLRKGVGRALVASMRIQRVIPDENGNGLVTQDGARDRDVSQERVIGRGKDGYYHGRGIVAVHEPSRVVPEAARQDVELVLE